MNNENELFEIENGVLTYVTIPKNVEFGIWVFRDCTSLKSLTTHEGEEIPLLN
ncbi:MAG: hypothetical protein II223_02745 [Treponema sp.]|nr:hypothetical protein [Treponema sp.]MBQ5876857.1 hypothetical protein [Treponema sp.]